MKRYRIKELGDIVTGNTPSKKNLDYYNSEDIPFFKPDSLDENEVAYLTTAKEYLSSNAKSVARIVPRETVLFSCIGSIGKIGITNVDNSSFNQQINAIIPNKEIILPKYLCYALKYNKKKIQAIANAAVVPIINKTQFSEFEISIHQKEEQVKVVKILDQAQELIDKRKAQIEALDELIQSVFYDMFGDPGLNSKGWETGRISDIIVKTQYGTSTKANETEGEYAVLRMNNITYSGNWDFKSLKYVDLDEKDREKYLVYKGEVLFNRTNSKELVGKTAVYKREKPMAYAGYLVKATPNNRANGQFIASYMNTKYTKSLLFNMAKNIVGMANINAEEFKNIKVYIPPIEIQDQFAEIVENIEKQKELLNERLVELENNFNSLMQRAFNGGSLR